MPRTTSLTQIKFKLVALLWTLRPLTGVYMMYLVHQSDCHMTCSYPGMYPGRSIQQNPSVPRYEVNVKQYTYLPGHHMAGLISTRVGSSCNSSGKFSRVCIYI